MIPYKGHFASVSVVLATLLLVSAVAVAQDEPVVIGQRPKLENVHINKPDLVLEFESIYSQSKNKTEQGKTKARELVFTEKLEVATEGYILNPNFIDMSLAGDFGLSQTTGEINGSSGTEDGTVYTWDINATYRRSSNTPFGIFSQRDQSFLSREFGETLESTNMNTGAFLELRTGWLPSRFQVSRQDISQSAVVTGELDFSLTRDNFNWQSRAIPGKNQNLTWTYDYNHVEQTGQTNSDYDTHNATLIHEYVFGRDLQSTLSSQLDYSMQSADPSLQMFRWDERLYLRHSDTFETRYRYTFNQYEYSSSDIMRNQASAEFTHRLYKSLITRGKAMVTKVDESDGVSSMLYDLDLNFDYTKSVPYGTLHADLNLFYGYQDNSSRSQETTLYDRPAKFNDPAPIVLTGPNIQAGSVILTDPSGLFIYTEGLDYTVASVPGAVEITRVVGGQIPSNSAVLVDYTLGAVPGNVVTTSNIAVGSRYDIEEGWLNGLSVYARYALQDQGIDPSDPTVLVSNSYTDILAGVQYHRGPWLATAEYQIHDSDIVPYNASRLSLQYDQQRGAWTATGNAAYTILDYVDENNLIELLTLSAQVRYQFTRRLDATLTLLWRDQQEDIGGSVRGFEQQLELRWWYRQTHVFGRLRNSMLETDTQDNDFQFFQMGIRREL